MLTNSTTMHAHRPDTIIILLDIDNGDGRNHSIWLVFFFPNLYINIVKFSPFVIRLVQYPL